MKDKGKTKQQLLDGLETSEGERKQAEEALQQSENTYIDFADFLPQTVFEVDEAGNFTFVNINSLELFDFAFEDSANGWNALQMFVPEDQDSVKESIQTVLGGGELSGTEYTARGRDGVNFPVLVYARPIFQENKATRLRGIAIDITEIKQAEEQIKQAAEEWRTTFDSITDLVSIHDKDFKLVRVNKAFADAFKMKQGELVGKTCYQVVHGTNEPTLSCPLMKTLETKEPVIEDFFEPHLGIHLEVATSPMFNEEGGVVAFVHVARDITERKKMQEQLMAQDRLASIGELAAGIAHELNNPLTGVIGFSDLLLEKDLPDDVKEDLKIINREAHRTAEVVRGLLTFARKQGPEKGPVDINGAIKTVLALRAYEQKVSNIEVNTEFAPDLPEVMADSFQLQQVFLNIIINAEYFMIEAHGRGTLTITTERVGNVIRASFADDGPGIPEENLRHLFDPFFTTKEVGKGTGLGLSISYGIISEHNGRIYVESELGKGATFVVELPIPK
ncbi:PAS domain S-box protein [Chloroflexota bacterium]